MDQCVRVVGEGAGPGGPSWNSHRSPAIETERRTHRDESIIKLEKRIANASQPRSEEPANCERACNLVSGLKVATDYRATTKGRERERENTCACAAVLITLFLCTNLHAIRTLAHSQDAGQDVAHSRQRSFAVVCACSRSH